jgi:hypothetical protein
VLPYYAELVSTNVLRAAVGDIGSGLDTGEALLRLILDEYNREEKPKVCEYKVVSRCFKDDSFSRLCLQDSCFGTV